MWHYLRIDRLPAGSRCTFCKRELRSGKGIVVSDDAGVEFFSGPSCAKAHIGESEERILDVSRIALCVVVKAEKTSPEKRPTPIVQSPAPNMGTGAERRPPPPPLDRVETYVRLRNEMMSGFKFHASTALKEAHQELQTNSVLSEESKTRVSGLMRNAHRDSTVFSDENVRRCIAMEFWLKIALENTRSNRREYLTSMLSVLHSRWRLSQGQISGVNKWGENVRKTVDDFPLLDADVFARVVTPEFMHQKSKIKKPS